MLGQKHAARLSLIYLDIIGAAKVRLFFCMTNFFCGVQSFEALSVGRAYVTAQSLLYIVVIIYNVGLRVRACGRGCFVFFSGNGRSFLGAFFVKVEKMGYKVLTSKKLFLILPR